MDLIHELEAEFASLSESAAPILVTVATSEQEYQLRLPQLGLDFIAGLYRGTVLVLPIASVSKLIGSYLPIRTEQTLEQFLIKQRAPIRLVLSTTERQQGCWLLNIESGWIRVAIAQGVSWVPLEAIEALEIVAVDNSNH